MISTEMAKRVVLDGLYRSSYGCDNARYHETPVKTFDGMTVEDCLRLYGDTVDVSNHINNRVVMWYISRYNTVQVHLTLASL